MQQKIRVTLLIPALFSQLKSAHPIPALNNLALLLSKAKLQALSVESKKLALLAHLSGLDALHYDSAAALALYASGEDVNSWVCYVSPVLMQPNRDHLAIAMANGFQFEDNEVTALCAEFNDHFKEDGLQFLFKSADSWFCRMPGELKVSNYAPQQIVGENIMAYLPSDRTDIKWRKLFNETQMLLHHSSANQARIENGKIEINSLWFWGGGVLPPAYGSPFNHIYSSDPVVSGFAKLGGCISQFLPEVLEPELIRQGAEHLIFMDLEQDANVYLLIEDYCLQLIQLLKNSSIDEVRIVPDYQQQFCLRANDLKKFWKPRRAISSFI